MNSRKPDFSTLAGINAELKRTEAKVAGSVPAKRFLSRHCHSLFSATASSTSKSAHPRVPLYTQSKSNAVKIVSPVPFAAQPKANSGAIKSASVPTKAFIPAPVTVASPVRSCLRNPVVSTVNKKSVSFAYSPPVILITPPKDNAEENKLSI